MTPYTDILNMFIYIGIVTIVIIFITSGAFAITSLTSQKGDPK